MLKGQSQEERKIAIKNDGFFPDLDVDEFSKVRTLPMNTDASLLEMSLIFSMSAINRQLAEFKQIQTAKGCKTIDDVVQSVPSEYSSVYKIAVYARAKADLVGEWVTTANQKEKISENQVQTQSALLAESARAVRHLSGRTRVGVSLL